MRPILLLLLSCIAAAQAIVPELVLTQDDRKAVSVAAFGFLAGGQLSLNLQDLEFSNLEDPGTVAFYIRKARRTLFDDEESNQDASSGGGTDNNEKTTPDRLTCFLDNSYIKDEVNDGISIVQEVPVQSTVWQSSLQVGPQEEGLWQVIFVNCKQQSTVSFRLTIEQVNPGNNHLSAGDTPLPKVYGASSAAYLVAALYWFSLLVFRKDTRVFRAHWLIAKFYYKKTGALTEGWQIGFYVFASVKGILSILIIVLLASGWMFIKPFLSAKDKRVISVVVPLQVLANIASAIGSEAAVGSTDRSFWNMLLPIIDLAGCCIVLWTILQTRKHLGTGSSADGKEVDVLNKYKLWSSFYIVTLVYVYITRIIVQLLQASLPFRYVTWLGEAVNEFATFLFYIFIGYKFRPYPNNPYTQVPGDEQEDVEGSNVDNGDLELRTGAEGEGAMRLYPVSRARSTPSPSK
ncbi:lung seven transmembrane receptor-domain-containing protein [Zychaea mexicana]|uniref:lung seven transmembrane receptor-domain-containing protein n=1 Tax=Zychaea mexicana TaxID=64656 RepID=UPI0022FF0B04|nr:lung seven transmembrane receptor-domain-containing protein [Zychaea mexicana]KAI9495123.1 lung seven transmembrane receptor-domain-containing protein [Zychaea mexicana]